jgi:3-oxoacyl-[acyl-carrier protein] reductase
MFDFSRQVVLITGGTRGIGRAASLGFAAAGARVYSIFERNVREARLVEREADRMGHFIRALCCNVADADEVRDTVGRVLAIERRIDACVLNAGIWTPGAIGRMKESVWDETLAVNLRGTFLFANAVVPAMRRRRGGRIVIVSSTAGQRGEAFHSHYAASKSGQIGFTKSLAAELAPDGILVNCVAPGWVETDMTRAELTSRARRKIFDTIPLRRAAHAEEIAGAIMFLASPLAAYITGEVLNVNGGSVLCG